MSPPSTPRANVPARNPGPTLTPVQTNFCVAIFELLDPKVAVDWDVLAHRLGLKDGKIARIRYGQIKKSITDAANGTPKKPRPTPTPTPTKKAVEGKGRGGKKRKLAAAKEEGETVEVKPARED